MEDTPLFTLTKKNKLYFVFIQIDKKENVLK